MDDRVGMVLGQRIISVHGRFRHLPLKRAANPCSNGEPSALAQPRSPPTVAKPSDLLPEVERPLRPGVWCTEADRGIRRLEGSQRHTRADRRP